MIFVNNFSPVAFGLGPLEVRWYGLAYAIGLMLTYFYIASVYKREKLPVEKLDSVAIYLFFGMLIGARLGHVFFYNAGYFLSHPIEILKVWNGGLASHGGAIGVLVAYLIWIKVHKVKFSKYADKIVLGIPILAGFIRIGNFFNSELYGNPTDGSWGVIFRRLGEDFPRHPVQIYAALISWATFFIMFVIYRKYKKAAPLFFVFLYVLIYFSGRFIVEYWKDFKGHTGDIPLDMGQILSIVPILIAVVYFVFYFPKKSRT
ncbi:MAG: prolipoprotein diacylglyceryl transferase [bacterium]|nr:prolipoprotein diacylglyceryl transferase [bacterium]